MTKNVRTYILKLSRYVHLNPVFVKVHNSKTVQERIRVLRHYSWSSYPSYIGRSKRLDYVDYAPILEMIEHSKRKQAGTYRRFVESGIDNIDAAFIADKRRSCLCIGSAVLLGIKTGAGVCQQVRRVDGKLRSDRHLQTVLHKIENELQTVRK